jgi:ribosomal protein S18 acetylase RimI-like enzyme
VQVRRARPEDAAAIADVHVRTWQAAYEHVFGAERLGTIEREQRLGQWERAVVDERVAVWVAEDGGRIVGFVSVGPSRVGDEGELYAIYVLPEAWGSGAGPALMGEAAAVLRDRYQTSILWVLDDNPRARRFYEREGWALDGGTQTEEFLGIEVTEVRYRITRA